MKRVVFLVPAEEEMTEAALFYESRAEGLGAKFLDHVERAVAAVTENPEAYPPARGEIRKKRVSRFPFALLYRVEADAITILAVMHMHRRPGYWEQRV